jgi:hypothetical protein
MELIIVSGIQVLALMLVQAADYLAQRRPKRDASPRRARKATASTCGADLGRSLTSTP